MSPDSNFSSLEERVEAIRNLMFRTNLRELDVGWSFFGYYRRIVEWYDFIEKILVKFKTKAFKDVPKKGKQGLRCA